LGVSYDGGPGLEVYCRPSLEVQTGPPSVYCGASVFARQVPSGILFEVGCGLVLLFLGPSLQALDCGRYGLVT
jgi:hypothetical protein